jgi:hypothetical protein
MVLHCRLLVRQVSMLVLVPLMVMRSSQDLVADIFVASPVFPDRERGSD